MKIERVLVLEPTPHTEAVRQILGSGVRVDVGPFSRDELFAAVGDCDALFARLGHDLNAELLGRAPRLRVIATPTTGITHIDVPYATQHGIDVLTLRGESELLEQLPATAELTWALVLAVVRRVVAASRHTEKGGWNRNEFWSIELAGRTLGVLGLGRIGRMVANYGSAFGMRVLAHDIHAPTEEVAVEMTDKRDLLLRADVVCLHAPFDHGDSPLLGSAELGLMKPGSILVNTSRGELIDEAALIHAIRSGRLAGAGLDVLANEPKVSRELLDLQATHNVVVTPHIGGATTESIEKTELFMARKLRRYLDSQPA